MCGPYRAVPIRYVLPHRLSPCGRTRGRRRGCSHRRRCRCLRCHLFLSCLIEFPHDLPGKFKASVSAVFHNPNTPLLCRQSFFHIHRKHPILQKYAMTVRNASCEPACSPPPFSFCICDATSPSSKLNILAVSILLTVLSCL